MSCAIVVFCPSAVRCKRKRRIFRQASHNPTVERGRKEIYCSEPEALANCGPSEVVATSAFDIPGSMRYTSARQRCFMPSGSEPSSPVRLLVVRLIGSRLMGSRLIGGHPSLH